MPISLPLTDALGTLFVVLVVMLLAPLAAEKLRLPSLLGLVLAGLLIGPSGFRLISGGANIEHAGSIATAYIFFLIGIGIDGSTLARGKGSRMGLRIFLASGLVGFSAAFFLLKMAPLPSLFIALLFGSETALSPSLREKGGFAGSDAGALVDSSLALTDLLRTSLFALLAALAQPSTVHWSASLGLTLAAALLIVLVMPRLAALFFKRAKPNESIDLLFILLLVFASAYICSLAGIQASTGTFIAGLLLGRFIPEGSALNRRLRFAGDLVFMPLFLIVFGMGIDMQAAAASPAFPSLLLLCLALAFGARLVLLIPEGGDSRSERLATYGFALGQGGSTLALVFIAERLRLASPALSLAAAIACIATSFASPLLARTAHRRLEQGADKGPAGGAQHSRIMVALANPASLRGLMELALALRRKDSREPLIPLAVIPESDENEVELAKEENLLAKAIVQANAAGAALSPTTRVAVNAAEGIKQAAAEFGASILILGWNRAPKLSQAFSGNIAARVIEERRELVVVAKLPHPLKECQRVALVLPPLVDKHTGFENALAALLPLLSYSGAHLTIYSTSPNGSAARLASSRLRSRGAAQIVELAAWKDLAKAASNETPSLFVIFCPRPGNTLWHPAIEKLPHLLGEDFPEASVLLFYLAEAPFEEGEKGEAPGEEELNIFDAASEAGRVMVGMEETAITDGIRVLLARDFGTDRKTLGRLTARFTEIAQKEPIELEPGVLLLHAHVPNIEEPRVYFGARPAGFRLLALEEPVRILVVLCAPEGQSPEAHLKVLGELAGLFTEKGLKDKLLSSDKGEK